MKIALVHDFLHRLGGAERVLKEFADHFPESPIYCLVYDEAAVGHVFPKERIRTSSLQKWYTLTKKIPGVKSLPTRILLGGISKAVEQFALDEYDLVLSSHTAWAHGIVTGTDTTHVCYCHSPMRFAWDYTNEYKRSIADGAANLLLSHVLHKPRQWDALASTRPDVYLTNSHNVRRRVEKYYDREVHVVYPPVDVDQIQPTQEKENYFLIVSTLAAYKRIDMVIETFNKIDRRLVIVGDGPERRRLQAMAQDNIEFRGFVSDEEVQELQKHARAFIFPGEDDFGMTPVEAMAHGTPIIAYAKGGALEVVEHGKTGVFFQKQTAESLEKAIAGFFTVEHWDRAYLNQQAKRFGKRNFWRQMNKILRPYIPRD